MLDRVEGRLAFIKAELNITEQQTPVWNELAEAVRNAAKHRNARMKDYNAGKIKTYTLLERLDAHEQVLSITLEDVKQIKLTANKLYAVLTDAQKKEADDIVLPMMGFGRWGWHRWRD
jgi:Na+-transporting NADH:ubiquinone oxidoreductase subunit NqrC